MKFNLIRFINIFLLFVFISISSSVYAAGETTTPAPSSGGDTSELLGFGNGATFEQDIKKAINGLTGAIDEFQKSFKAKVTPDGVRLLGLLSLITISIAGFKLALTSGSLSEPMSQMITTIFTIGIASYLITDSGYELMFVKGIDGSMKQIASYALPGNGDLSNGFSNFMQSEFQIIGNVISTLKDYTLIDWFTKAGFTLLLVIFMFLALLLMSLLGMIAVLTALVMTAIALALGPIFIPFLVSERFSFLFDGWLKFTINACLTKVVVAILLGIGVAAFDALGHNFSGGATNSMAGTLLAALSISGVIGTLMLAAPGIAGQITSGGSISGDGFAGRMHSVASKMGRSASVQASHGAGNMIQNRSRAGGAVSNLAERLRGANSGGSIRDLSRKAIPPKE